MAFKTEHFNLVELDWDQTSSTTWRSSNHYHVRGYILNSQNKNIGYMVTIEVGKAYQKHSGFLTLEDAQKAAYEIIDKYLMQFLEP